MWQLMSRASAFLRVGCFFGIGLLLVAETSIAQPPTTQPPAVGRRGSLLPMMAEPLLSRELRNEAFAAKIKITEEQRQRINEIEITRREYFRREFSVRGTPPSEEVLAKFKEFETNSVNVLTPDQKEIWELRKADLKAEQAARPIAREPAVVQGPAEASDRDRIRALEEEVKILKAEITKLKAAMAASATNP